MTKPTEDKPTAPPPQRDKPKAPPEPVKPPPTNPRYKGKADVQPLGKASEKTD